MGIGTASVSGMAHLQQTCPGVQVYKEPASAKQREKQRVYRMASEAPLNDDSDQAHTLVRVPCDMATPASTWGADITTAPGLASVRSQKMEGALHARRPPLDPDPVTRCACVEVVTRPHTRPVLRDTSGPPHTHRAPHGGCAQGGSFKNGIQRCHVGVM